eukprot:1485473-Alexandrium_andersonii.AAC.1
MAPWARPACSKAPRQGPPVRSRAAVAAWSARALSSWSSREIPPATTSASVAWPGVHVSRPAPDRAEKMLRRSRMGLPGRARTCSDRRATPWLSR